MKIAFNITPLETGHKTRGVGFYTKNLLRELESSDLNLIKFKDLKEISSAQVVHYPWFDLFFKTLPLRKKFPTVVTVHDVMPLVFSQQYPIGIKGSLNLLWQKLSLRTVKFIITDSLCSKKDIIKYLNFPSNRVIVIPLAPGNEFKLLSDSEKLRVKRKLSLPDSYILYVGDANYVKNLPFLAEGFRSLIKDNNFPNLKLLLINGIFKKDVSDIDHPELRSLKEFNDLIKKYGLEKNIFRLGQVETEDLVGVYNMATLYVQPSLYEGFGLPILEAMSCGTPVACSTAESLREIASDAVLYFNPKDLNEFISVLRNFLETPSLRQRHSQLGLKQTAKFTWRKVANETIAVYYKADNI